MKVQLKKGDTIQHEGSTIRVARPMTIKALSIEKRSTGDKQAQPAVKANAKSDPSQPIDKARAMGLLEKRLEELETAEMSSLTSGIFRDDELFEEEPHAISDVPHDTAYAIITANIMEIKSLLKQFESLK